LVRGRLSPASTLATLGAAPLRGRLMVGRLTLDQEVGVRIPAPQLEKTRLRRPVKVQDMNRPGCVCHGSGLIGAVLGVGAVDLGAHPHGLSSVGADAGSDEGACAEFALVE